jgi:extracellular factor (EF) 3-hydroxypalmitic acid methyl ester biosynthesis protein
MAQQNGELKESLVVGLSSQAVEVRGTLLKLTRYQAVFEVYSPGLVLSTSEVLTDFKVVISDRTIYSGRSVISSIVNTGTMLICEATLEESSWLDVEFGPGLTAPDELARGFTSFMQEWQKLYRVRPEYKIIIADMQSFFIQLRLWLEQTELAIRASPSGDRLKLEQSAADGLAESVVSAMNVLFEKFELVANTLESELEPVHRSYMRQQLHPWVMCAPFPHRAFNKPLGYAGDYEMVNMMLRGNHAGASLFAKLVNAWFVRQAPAQAHRNRIDYLAGKLLKETARASAASRDARIYNVGCGPAHEVQRFLSEQAISSKANVTLLDFNEETLEYAQTRMREASSSNGRSTKLNFIKRSVHTILKESGRTLARSANDQYDLVYCAGLFDYLSDPICRRLTSIMYEWLVPGGLLIATNVHPSNPMRKGMEHLLDWHLTYRTAPQLFALRPRQAPDDAAVAFSDVSGVNVFLEVRKPQHG